MGQRCLIEDCSWVLVNHGVLRRSRSTASTVVQRCYGVASSYYGTVVGTYFGVYCNVALMFPCDSVAYKCIHMCPYSGTYCNGYLVNLSVEVSIL